MVLNMGGVLNGDDTIKVCRYFSANFILKKLAKALFDKISIRTTIAKILINEDNSFS